MPLEIARRQGVAPLVLFLPWSGHHLEWSVSEGRIYQRSLDAAAQIVHASPKPDSDAIRCNHRNAMEWAVGEVHEGYLFVVLGEPSNRIDDMIGRALKTGLEVQQIR
jgi:hypothetical protein